MRSTIGARCPLLYDVRQVDTSRPRSLPVFHPPHGFSGEAHALRGSAKTAALTPAGWAAWGGDAGGDGDASLWVAESEDEEFGGVADASSGEEHDADAALHELCDALRCVRAQPIHAQR